MAILSTITGVIIIILGILALIFLIVNFRELIGAGVYAVIGGVICAVAGAFFDETLTGFEIGLGLGFLVGLIDLVDWEGTLDVYYMIYFLVISGMSWVAHVFNYLQYFLMCPWRYLMKDYNSVFSKIARSKVGKTILKFLAVVLYIVSTPLRLVNAAYYNLVLRMVSSLFDTTQEVFAPMARGRKDMGAGKYILMWLVDFPYRIVRYLILKNAFFLLEGVLFTIFDTFVPTLTMYHGTSKDASVEIASKGKWKVGAGAWAGSGIYFAIARSTAANYGAISSNGSNAKIIMCRVSMGRILNLNQADWSVRSHTREGGHIITKYGLDNGYTTVEWWREKIPGRQNGDWWEYCLLDHGNYYNHPWRTREIIIYDADSRFRQRVYGGMATWLLH